MINIFLCTDTCKFKWLCFSRPYETLPVVPRLIWNLQHSPSHSSHYNKKNTAIIHANLLFSFCSATIVVQTCKSCKNLKYTIVHSMFLDLSWAVPNNLRHSFPMGEYNLIFVLMWCRGYLISPNYVYFYALTMLTDTVKLCYLDLGGAVRYPNIWDIHSKIL